MAQELDLAPAPRVLQMLGEINLEQWRRQSELYAELESLTPTENTTPASEEQAERGASDGHNA